ncbi:hypothetical protein V6N13_064045 [Hibiscus sabdariffa]|uniref:Uncharacterized protein n=1 Tax=Hibiscus sabdariffa TaxID=183260 RepID=A0ABR2R249_9ROSI
MFSYPLQITESQPVTNIHDTHASLVGGLPVGWPPDSLPSIVDSLEATMTEAEANLIMLVFAGNEIFGDPAMAENNQSGQQLSFKDMLLGKRAAGNKRDPIENGARDSPDTQASGSRFVALQDHVLNDDIGGEGDRMTTRAGIMHDGVNMVGKAKEVHPTRSRQTCFAVGNSSMPFTKSAVNCPTITVNGPGECSSGVSSIRAVGELHEVQARVKKWSHTIVRISDPVEDLVVIIEDPVVGSASGTSIMQSNHRGFSVSKSSSRKGVRIRRLADVRKSTLPILGEWVNSVTRELSKTAEPPCVVSSVDKENVLVH